MIVGTLLAIAFLWVFVFLPRQIAYRNHAADFAGVVEDKEIRARQSRYSSGVRYLLVIRDESGKLVRFRVPRAVYERALVGMPVRKRAGEPLPTLGAGTF